MKVEFEHRRVEPTSFQVTVGAQRLPESMARTLARRIRTTRWLVLFVGAAGVAFATRRAGLELGQALCVFSGALPALWVLGWLSGTLFHLRRTAREASARMGSNEWKKELDASTRKERVTLELLDTGLAVEREGHQALVGFQRVAMARVSPELLVIQVDSEPFQVPRAAFPDAAKFDAFCLALQARLWGAQRR